MTKNISKINDKSILEIPKGDYCYSIIGWEDVEGYTWKKPIYKCCPYFTTKKFGEGEAWWCSFLELGDVGNGDGEENYQALLKHFGGSEEEMDKTLPLFLLWDQVKECGENHYTEEEENNLYES